MRVFDHNINQLVNLLNQGISPNPHSVTALTDFLLTTNWVPKAEALQALHFDGFIHNIRMSHDLDDLPFLYSQPFENSSNVIDEFTPLYWSAGLITHPQMAEKTRNYQSKKALTKNKHLWPLSYFFFSDVSFASSMQQYEHFSKGQVYTGIKLNVYKRPTYGLVFSSFELYNPHYCGFQQFPWIANLRGVPIWSQSGLGSESISGFGIHNTHNPAIQQIQDIMLITYLAPDALSGLFVRNLFSSHVRFFWPIPLFDKHIVKEYSKQSNEDNAKVREKKKIFPSFSFKGNGKAQMIKKSPILPSNEDESIMKSDKHKVWCIGQRESLFVAVLCTKGVYLDYKDTNDARFTYRVDDSSVTVTIPRLICEAKRHSWIVVVGTIMEYPDIDAFIDSKLSHITVQEEIKDGVSYDILIVDGERQLRYSYDLRRREQILQSNTKV